MAEVHIFVDGVDVTDSVLFATARFKSQVNGKPGDAFMRIRDLEGVDSFSVGADWLLTVGGGAAWRGYVTQITRTYVFPAYDVASAGPGRFFDIRGSDLNILFAERVVYNKATPTRVEGTQFPPATPDTTAITELLRRWLDIASDDLDTTTGVTTVASIDPYEPTEAWSGGWTWGQAMTAIAMIPAAIFYIRPEVGTPRGTLCYVDVDTATAPFPMTDASPVAAEYQDQGLISAVWEASHLYEPEVASLVVGGDGYLWFANISDPTVSGTSEPAWDIDNQPVSDGVIDWFALPLWAPAEFVGEGGFLQPTVGNGHYYFVTRSGIDSGPEPAWPTDGGTVVASGGDVPIVGRYREMEIILDGTSFADDVMGWGMGYGSQTPVFRRERNESVIGVNGLWQQAIVAFGVYKQGTIDRMVESIIYGSPSSHRGAATPRTSVRLTTYVPGLLAGHVVDFRSEVWGFGDNIPVRQLEITFEAPDTPRYDIILSHEIDAPWSFIDQFWPRIPRLPGFPGNPVLPGLPQQENPCRECGVTPTGPEIVETDISVTDLFLPDQQWTAVQFVTDGYGSVEVVYGPTGFDSGPPNPRLITGLGVEASTSGEILDNDGDPVLTFPVGTWVWNRSRQYIEWNSLPATTTHVRLYTFPGDGVVETGGTADVVYEWLAGPNPPYLDVIDDTVNVGIGWVVDRVDFTGDPSYGTTGTGIASFGTTMPEEPSYFPQSWDGGQFFAENSPLNYDTDLTGTKFQVAAGMTTDVVPHMNTDVHGIFTPPRHVIGVESQFGDFSTVYDFPAAGWYGAGGGVSGLATVSVLDVTYTTTGDVQEFTTDPYVPGSLRVTIDGEPYTDFVESDPASGKFQIPDGVDTTGITVCLTLPDTAVAVSDDFNRADGDLSGTTTTTGNRVWAPGSSDIQIVSNAIVMGGGDGNTWGEGFPLVSSVPITMTYESIQTSFPSAGQNSVKVTASDGTFAQGELGCDGTDIYLRATISNGIDTAETTVTFGALDFVGTISVELTALGITITAESLGSATALVADATPDPLPVISSMSTFELNGISTTNQFSIDDLVISAGAPCADSSEASPPASPSGFGCANATRGDSTTYSTPTRYRRGAIFVWVDGLFMIRDDAFTEDDDQVTIHFTDPVDADAVVRVCYFAEGGVQ